MVMQKNWQQKFNTLSILVDDAAVNFTTLIKNYYNYFTIE